MDGQGVLTCTQVFFRSRDRVYIRCVLDRGRLDGHLHFRIRGPLWVDDLDVTGQYIGPLIQTGRP